MTALLIDVPDGPNLFMVICKHRKSMIKDNMIDVLCLWSNITGSEIQPLFMNVKLNV